MYRRIYYILYRILSLLLLLIFRWYISDTKLPRAKENSKFDSSFIRSCPSRVLKILLAFPRSPLPVFQHLPQFMQCFHFFCANCPYLFESSYFFKNVTLTKNLKLLLIKFLSRNRQKSHKHF